MSVSSRYGWGVTNRWREEPVFELSHLYGRPALPAQAGNGGQPGIQVVGGKGVSASPVQKVSTCAITRVYRSSPITTSTRCYEVQGNALPATGETAERLLHRGIRGVCRRSCRVLLAA